MSPTYRTLMTLTAAVMALAFTSTAEARHHRRAVRAAPAAPILVPAHEKPGFVHAVGPGLIDLGLGPVFPFGGWPKSL